MAKFNVGDKAKAKDPKWVGYQGSALGHDVYTVKKVDRDGTVKLDGFLDLWISPDSLVAANSRACNSTNAIVRKAMNAEDAQGHEHGSDGKFTSKSGGKKDSEDFHSHIDSLAAKAASGEDGYEDPKTKRMKERLAKMREKNEALRKEIDQRKAALAGKKEETEKMRADVMKANVEKWKAGLPKTKNTIVEKAINAVAKNDKWIDDFHVIVTGGTPDKELVDALKKKAAAWKAAKRNFSDAAAGAAHDKAESDAMAVAKRLGARWVQQGAVLKVIMPNSVAKNATDHTGRTIKVGDRVTDVLDSDSRAYPLSFGVKVTKVLGDKVEITDKYGNRYTEDGYNLEIVGNAVVTKALNAVRNAEDDFLQYYADSYSYIPKVGEIYKYDGKRVKCTSVQKLQRGNDDRDRFLVEGRVVG